LRPNKKIWIYKKNKTRLSCTTDKNRIFLEPEGPIIPVDLDKIELLKKNN